MEKEEALNILNGYMGGEIDPESTELYHAIELVVDILESQPSLPTDLNKAAHRYAWDKQDMAYDAEGQAFFDYGPRYDSFKAGAKWMSEQGETQGHFVIGSIADSPCGPAVVCYTEEFAIGDQVIVQIRKK